MREFIFIFYCTRYMRACNKHLLSHFHTTYQQVLSFLYIIFKWVLDNVNSLKWHIGPDCVWNSEAVTIFQFTPSDISWSSERIFLRTQRHIILILFVLDINWGAMWCLYFNMFICIYVTLKNRSLDTSKSSALQFLFFFLIIR